MPGRQKSKKPFRLFIPDHIQNPVELARRLLFSRNRSARFTLLLTGLAVLLTPIDWILSKLEGRHTVSADTPTGPHIFICGPARSGTTFMYQVFARYLNVAYTRNLCTLLPRSVRTSSRLCAALFNKNRSDTYLKADFENYYGKTNGFSAPSDGNFLWNQWVKPDASLFRTILSVTGAYQMAKYYRTLGTHAARPTLAKNNNANVFANKIADSLENCYFICLRRDPVYLAQSLIRARLEINGDLHQSYGVIDVEKTDIDSDPYNEVFDQIDFLNNTALEQQSMVGEDCFWIVDYEEFCADPTSLINRVREKILQQAPIPDRLAPFSNANKVVDAEIFQRVTEVKQKRDEFTASEALGFAAANK